MPWNTFLFLSQLWKQSSDLFLGVGGKTKYVVVGEKVSSMCEIETAGSSPRSWILSFLYNMLGSNNLLLPVGGLFESLQYIY